MKEAASGLAFFSAMMLMDSAAMSVVTDTGLTKKPRPVQYVGAPNGASFSQVLDLLNRKFSTHGAFLLEGGFGINPNRSAGNIFMTYGHELQFFTKVDFARLAFAT